MEKKYNENLENNSIDNKNNNEEKKTINIIPVENNTNDNHNNKVDINMNKNHNKFYSSDEILNLENKEIFLSQGLKEIQSYIDKIKSNKNYINGLNGNVLNTKSDTKNNSVIKIKNNEKKKNSTIVHYYNNTSKMRKDKKDNSIFMKSENKKDRKRNNFLIYTDKSEKKGKIKVFDRLFEDRKNKFRQNSENKLNKDFISSEKINKRYNNLEWNQIYQKRFKSYQDNIYKKREEMKQQNENEIKRKEDEIINLHKYKKASIEHIIEVSQRMYDEAKKRKLKIEEKKMNSKNIIDIDDSFYNYVKKINCDLYVFDGTENRNKDYKNDISNHFIIKKNKNCNVNINNKSIKKNIKMNVNELNSKRFEKNFQLNKINDNKYYKNNRYIFNNNYINKNDLKSDDNIIYVDGYSYNLDEERKN